MDDGPKKRPRYLLELERATILEHASMKAASSVNFILMMEYMGMDTILRKNALERHQTPTIPMLHPIAMTTPFDDQNAPECNSGCHHKS
jgi:hypothetical protein